MPGNYQVAFNAGTRSIYALWSSRIQQLRRSSPENFQTMIRNCKSLKVGNFYWNVLKNENEIHRLVEIDHLQYELHGPFGEFDSNTCQIKEYSFEEYFRKRVDTVAYNWNSKNL